jgi:hypothetical protein
MTRSFVCCEDVAVGYVAIKLTLNSEHYHALTRTDITKNYKVPQF